MKTEKQILTILMGVLISLTLSLTGCGDNAEEAVSAFTAKTSCGQACTKYMDCSKSEGPAWLIQLLEDAGVYDEAYDDCIEECVDPLPEDEGTRDCALDCSLEMDCKDYYDCVCNCGIEVYEGQCLVAGL